MEDTGRVLLVSLEENKYHYVFCATFLGVEGEGGCRVMYLRPGLVRISTVDRSLPCCSDREEKRGASCARMKRRKQSLSSGCWQRCWNSCRKSICCR